MPEKNKLDNLVSRMTDLEHQTVQKDAFVEIYGGPGAGKTTLLAMIAQELREDGRVLWFDSSDGWVSLENKPELKKGVVRLEASISDMGAAADAIRRKAKGFDDFTVVVIDENSAVANDVLQQIVRERLGTPDDEIPEETPTWTDYYPAGQIVFRVLDAFHSIPGVHVLLSAHDQQKKDHRNVERTVPDYSPKLAEMVSRPLHVISHVTAEIKKVGSETRYVRSVQSQPSALVVAKSRIGGLGLKDDFDTYVKKIGDWVFGEAELVEESVELADDELPTDGVPITEEADEGILVED
jgi:energy-coupling factor transporter ATP-binding protein EcfA2